MILFIGFFMLLAIGILTIAVLNDKPKAPSAQRRPENSAQERDARKQDQQARTMAARTEIDEAGDIPQVSESTLRVPPPEVHKIEAVAPRNDGRF